MNEKPDLYTNIYWLVQDKKISPDFLFDFIEFVWPTFIEKDNYIFLKETFLIEKYNHLIGQQINPEFWINLLLVDPYFEEEDDGDEKAARLSRILMEIWQVKLKRDFPDREFVVECPSDIEVGDRGITFYQVKGSSSKSSR